MIIEAVHIYVAKLGLTMIAIEFVVKTPFNIGIPLEFLDQDHGFHALVCPLEILGIVLRRHPLLCPRYDAPSVSGPPVPNDDHGAAQVVWLDDEAVRKLFEGNGFRIGAMPEEGYQYAFQTLGTNMIPDCELV